MPDLLVYEYSSIILKVSPITTVFNFEYSKKTQIKKSKKKELVIWALATEFFK